MFRIGAHVSIADGFAGAVQAEHELGGSCGQIFVGSPRGWKVGTVDPDAAAAFQDAVGETGIEPWIVHGTYLINFATPKDDLAEKSMTAVQEEVDACNTLNIPYYTFHPGSHTGAGTETGIENVAARLSQIDVPDGVTILLENTAGGGTSLGKTVGELHGMIKRSSHGYDSLGVCLDSCHLYAAGHDFTTEAGMNDLIDELAEVIGIDNVHFLHLNDSKHPLGSSKDEHEHIGEGAIGEDGFRRFINHDALRDIPMVLETPVNDKGFDWDIKKVKELRQ